MKITVDGVQVCNTFSSRDAAKNYSIVKRETLQGSSEHIFLSHQMNLEAFLSLIIDVIDCYHSLLLFSEGN